MRVPMSWLREYVPDLPDVQQVAERLTMAGIEVEEIDRVGALSERAIAAAIMSVEPCQRPGQFRICVQVSPDGQTCEVLCSNAELARAPKGTRVALALPGATLLSFPGPRLRYVTGESAAGESGAVLCLESELGLSDRSVPAFLGTGAAPGSPLHRLVQRDRMHGADEVMVLSILPNTARCLAILGVAREVATLFNLEMRSAPISPAIPESSDVEWVPDLGGGADCVRFAAVKMSNVQVGESPLAVRLRLALCGTEVINNVVDASNYTMLEFGQPTHCYDLDRLESSRLVVRISRQGERIKDLMRATDQGPRELPQGVLLIASGDRPVAIAGISGDRESAVTSDTRNLLLECAAFRSGAVRESQQLLALSTAAATRFTRGVDPAGIPNAAARVVSLIQRTSPNLQVGAMGHQSLGHENRVTRIPIDMAKLNKVLGGSYETERSIPALIASGLEVEDRHGDTFTVVARSNRADITIDRDVYEEVGRLLGYDRIPETLPTGVFARHHGSRGYESRRLVHRALVAAGLCEIISYSLTSVELEERVLGACDERRHVQVINAAARERSAMRTSLLPSLLQAAGVRLTRRQPCRLFEIGQTFLPKPNAGKADLPDEPWRLGIAIGGPAAGAWFGQKDARAVDFFDLKGILESLFQRSRIAAPEFSNAAAHPFEPRQCALLSWDGRRIGYCGRVRDDVLKALGFDAHALYCAELDFEPLLATEHRDQRIRQPSPFPSVELDISFWLSSEAPAVRVVQCAREAAGPLLQEVGIIDLFQKDNQKSIAIRLRLNAMTRSMTTKEAMEVRDAVAGALRRELNAEIRE